MKEFFFVYGTLKQGYGNNRLLTQTGCSFVGAAYTKDFYAVADIGFPMAKLEEGGLRLLGEVYLVESDAVVQSLDHLESNGSFYTRSVRTVVLDKDQEELPAWIYEVNKVEGYRFCNINNSRVMWEWKR